MFTFAALSGCGASATKEQKLVKTAHEELKDMLLDPDSLIIYKCVGDYSTSDEEYEKEFSAEYNNESYEPTQDQFGVYFHYGAKNKMGGITESEIYFLFTADGDYINYATDKECEDDDFMSYSESKRLAIHAMAGYKMIEAFSTYFDEYGESGQSVEDDSSTDYTDFVKSKEFEKVEYEKI